MTQTREVPQIEAGIDEGGASKSFDTSFGTMASWFVPPVVVPAFVVALIIISAIYQRSW
jgi:hypothetical protein